MNSGTNAMAGTSPRCGSSHPCARRASPLLALLATGLLIAICCQAQTLTEPQLQARFLLNIARFTEWPDGALGGADDPLILCALGAAEPLDGALLALDGAAAGSHRVIVRTGVTAEQAANCQLLFVPDGELGRLPAVRDVIGRRPVLTVGESEAALAAGAMIALRKSDGHPGLVVKVGAARDCDLNFSPQLLNAAAEVLP